MHSERVLKHLARFALGSAEVQLCTNSEEVLAEARSYLEPHFESPGPSAPAAAVTWTVRVTDDPEWEARAGPAAEPLVIHNTKSHPTIGTVRRQPDGRRLICNATYGDMVTVDTRHRRVEIVGSRQNGALYPGGYSRLAGEVHNVTRHILRVEAENQGAIVLHGAVVAFDDTGIAFIGDKGAGKTTVLLSLLRRRGGSYVANDRFFLWPHAGRFRMTGWPTTCRINPATFIAFEELHTLIPKSERDALLGPDENAWRTSREKVLLLPRDIGPLLQASTRQSAEVKAVVLLEQAGEPLSSFADLPAGHAEDVLRRNLFTPVDVDYPNWLGLEQPPMARRQAASDQAVGYLLSSLPAFRLRLNPSLPTLLSCLDTILRAVGAPSGSGTAPVVADQNETDLVPSPFGFVAVPAVKKGPLPRSDNA